jgi:hypothetical protein
MRRLSRCAIEPAEFAGGKKPPQRKKNYVLRFWRGGLLGPRQSPFVLSRPRPVGSLQLRSLLSFLLLLPLVVRPLSLDSLDQGSTVVVPPVLSFGLVCWRSWGSHRLRIIHANFLETFGYLGFQGGGSLSGFSEFRRRKAVRQQMEPRTKQIRRESEWRLCGFCLITIIHLRGQAPEGYLAGPDTA